MKVAVSTSEIFLRVLTVFSLTLFGVVARKTGAFREQARQSVADIVLTIMLPALLFVSMATEITWDRLAAGVSAPVISFSLVLIMGLVTRGLARVLAVPAPRQSTFLVLGAMPNSSFMAYPVVFSVLGPEGLAYGILYDIGVTIVYHSLVVFALQGGSVNAKSFRSVLNPALVAVILGLGVNRAGIVIPETMLAPLRMMGNAAMPLAMLLTGYLLAGLKVEAKTFDLHLWAVCLCKLILAPALAYFLVMPLGLEPMVRVVILIVSAMPSMSSTPVLVQKYGGDPDFAVTGVFATTVLSVITIPLIVRLLG